MILKFIEKIFFKFDFVLDKYKSLNLLISLVSLGYLFNEIKDFNIDFHKNYIYISLIYIFGQFFYAYSWKTLLEHNLKTVQTNQISTWLLSIIGRYTPFKVGIPLLRKTNKDNDLEFKILFRFIITEQLISIFISLYFGILLLFNKNNYFQIILLLFFFLFFYLKKLSYVNIYFFSQLIVYLFIFALIFELTNIYNFYLPMIYIFSSGLSLFFIGSPAGLGIRELIFFNALNFANLDPSLFQIAIYIRILTTFSDLSIVSLVKLYKYLKS